MVKKQNILAIIIIFLNQPKTFMKTSYQETTSEAATSDLSIKIPNRKKISHEEFPLCEAEISLKPYKTFFK